jgi:nitrile hydratase
MNGVHDMGGMQDMRLVLPEPNEPVFHETWEARMHALALAASAWGKWSIDAYRSAIERTPPADYLRMSYYEKWLAALLILLEESGLASRAELESGHPAAGSAKKSPPLTADKVASGHPAAGSAKKSPPLTADKVAPMLAAGFPSERPVNRPARLAVGQSVRARKINPTGHTRLPRYARGNAGVVTRIHGAYVFPDSNAQFQGENPQRVYTVRFSARELWGEAAAASDSVYLDLWEDYLEPV